VVVYATSKHNRLLGQMLPRNAGLQHEDDARQRRPVGNPGPARDLRARTGKIGSMLAHNSSLNKGLAMSQELRQPHDESYLLLGALILNRRPTLRVAAAQYR
jgi:hypothetical protein